MTDVNRTTQTRTIRPTQRQRQNQYKDYLSMFIMPFATVLLT